MTDHPLNHALRALEEDLKTQLEARYHLPPLTTEGVVRHLAGEWPQPRIPESQAPKPSPAPLPGAQEILEELLAEFGAEPLVVSEGFLTRT